VPAGFFFQEGAWASGAMPQGVGCGLGCPLPTGDRVLGKAAPPPQKILRFLLLNGDLWHVLGGFMQLYFMRIPRFPSAIS